MNVLEEGNLFNLGNYAERMLWQNPIYVRSTAVSRGLARAERQLAEAEASCNENLIHELRNKVARFEHAKHRIETTRNIVSALAETTHV